MAEDNISDVSRPQLFLFGCVLTSDKRKYMVKVEDDDADHQLSLKAVCLGEEAEDKFHMVEIEGVTYDGKTTRFPLALLKPSVLPCVSLGGFEITPPVTFHLQSGSGPVHVSGQHFVSVKDSDDEEEENNTSPVKRPSSLTSGKRPAPKKLKMSESDDDDDDSDDEDIDDDDSDEDERDLKRKKKTDTPFKKAPETQKKKHKSALKQNGSPGKAEGSAVKPQTKTAGKGGEKSGAGLPPTIPEIKSKLASTFKQGLNLPKTQQKFANYTKNSFKVQDEKVVKDLWSFVQTLKK